MKHNDVVTWFWDGKWYIGLYLSPLAPERSIKGALVYDDWAFFAMHIENVFKVGEL